MPTKKPFSTRRVQTPHGYQTTVDLRNNQDTWNSALDLLTNDKDNDLPKDYSDSSKRRGYMHIQTRPPTCLKPFTPDVEPSQSKKPLRIKKKHNSVKIKSKRLAKSISTATRTKKSFNAKLNNRTSPAGLTIIDQIILQGYETKLRNEKQRKEKEKDQRMFGSSSSTHLEVVDGQIKQSIQRSKIKSTSMPHLQKYTTRSQKISPPPSPFTTTAAKVMSKDEAELIQKRGLVKVLERKRKEQIEKFGRSNSVLAQDIGELHASITKLTFKLTGGGDGQSNLSKEDYKEYMKIPLPQFDISPLKKQPSKKLYHQQLIRSTTIPKTPPLKPKPSLVVNTSPIKTRNVVPDTTKLLKEFNFDSQNKMKLKNVHSTNVNNNKDEQIFEHRDRSTFKDSTSDLTLFKFARSGETGWDQIETKHSKRKINFFQHGTYKSDAGAIAVIIVRIFFITVFLFYCLLYNHSFQINPNSVTNCFKLFLSITTLQQRCSCVAILIFEQVRAVSAIAIARRYLVNDGQDLRFRPEFISCDFEEGSSCMGLRLTILQMQV